MQKELSSKTDGGCQMFEVICFRNKLQATFIIKDNGDSIESSWYNRNAVSLIKFEYFLDY